MTQYPNCLDFYYKHLKQAQPSVYTSATAPVAGRADKSEQNNHCNIVGIFDIRSCIVLYL